MSEDKKNTDNSDVSHSDNDTDDYEVGYGRPPRHTRFKPGQSGNPKGRPRGTRNLKTDLLEELGQTIPVREDGKALKVSKQRAILKALTAKAVKGDVKAANALITMLFRPTHEDGVIAEDDGELCAEDIALLDQMAARRHGGNKQ